MNEERLEHAQAESAGVHTPSSPVREREKEEEKEREIGREREGERGRERERGREGEREKMQYTQ
jgi:hypothetical protein